MKVAIFGGSFNPVHNEHIKIGVSAVKELGVDKLFIMPTYVSPHKISANAVSGEHRLNMLNLAFNGVEGVEVCDYEIKKGGISYTYQTVEHFYEKYGEKVYFLMGSDMLENFPTWRYPEKILEKAEPVLIDRNSGSYDTEKIVEDFESKYGVKVKRLKVFGTTISSTMARVYNKLGLSLDGVVPKSVSDYISKNDLYAPNDYYSYVKNSLPEKRRLHTAGVILTALSLAKTLGVDGEKAELSALLHDVAKYKSPSDYPTANIDKDVPSDVVHQYLSYHVAKTVLGVSDEEVLLAIKYHTTGRANMTELERLIYIADLIEPSRRFSGVEELRTAVFSDFESGFKICLKEITEFLLLQNKPVYPLTLDAVKYYIGD